MYLRITRRRNKDGTEVAYYQLAENVYNKQTKRSEVRIIHNFGRSDAVDQEALKRLISSIRRVVDGEAGVGAGVGPVGLEIERVYEYGVVLVARRLWEELGIGPVLRERMGDGPDSGPHELALFAMTANRLDRPCSKLDCHENWLGREVYLPEASQLTVDQLYRGMDFLVQDIESVEREIFYRTADLFNLDVDLIFWDTTTAYCEVDEEDEREWRWQGHALTPLRKRGHSKEGRDGNPQVVIALAVTREGLPVRSWVFPGNTVDVSTVRQIREDLRSWRLGRCVMVGDGGMFSQSNLEHLSRGLGRYILAVPMRKVKEVKREVLARGGRYRRVAKNLRVKEVVVGEGERRRRYFVCFNREEARRQRGHREHLLELLRKELESLEQNPDEHPKAACRLLTSRRFGRYLKKTKTGRLRLDTAKIAQEAKYDGKFVIATNDDTLRPEDAGLGYKAMMIIEGCFRKMKTTGLKVRPIYHWTPRRIVAHVKLCVLALLLERVAEIRCRRPWRQIRRELEGLRVVQYGTENKTILQRTEIKPELGSILGSLGVSINKKVLAIID